MTYESHTYKSPHTEGNGWFQKHSLVQAELFLTGTQQCFLTHCSVENDIIQNESLFYAFAVVNIFNDPHVKLLVQKIFCQ